MEKLNKTKSLGYLKYILYFIILPNLIFIMSLMLYYMDRFKINLDYITASFALFYLVKKRIKLTIFFFIFFLALIFDIALMLGELFYFDIFDLSGFISDEEFGNLNSFVKVFIDLFSFEYVVIVLLILATLITFYFKFLFNSQKQILSISKLFPILLLTLLIVANCQISGKKRFSDTLINGKLAYSSIYNGFSAIKLVARHKPANFIKANDYNTVTLFQSLDVKEKVADKVFVFLIESFGVLKNKKLQSYILEESLGEIDKSRYSYTESEIKMKGYSVMAEIRDLCGLIIDSAFPNGQETEFEDCLGHRFKNIGYQTIGIHNFTYKAFSRYIWYKSVGLNRTYFTEEHQEKFPNAKICGENLKGVCGEEILEDFLMPYTRNDFRQFVYWMNMDGHVPYKGKALTGEGRKICNKFNIDNIVICEYVNTQIASLKKVFKFLNQIDPKNTVQLYLAGDHSPPFVNSGNRAFFEPSKVTSIIVQSKDLTK